MERELGFYWVNDGGKWIVAEYGEFYNWLCDKNYGWHLPGSAESYCEGEYCCAPIYGDDCFIEINETRLIAPNG